MASLIDPKACYVPNPDKAFFDIPYSELAEKQHIELAAHYFGRLIQLTDSKTPQLAKSEDRRFAKPKKPQDVKDLTPKVVVQKPGMVKFFLDFRMDRPDLIKFILSDPRFKDDSARKNAAQVVKVELDSFNAKMFASINSFHIFVDFVRDCIARPNYVDRNVMIESVDKINRIFTVYHGIRNNVWARLQDKMKGECLFPRIKFQSFLKECDLEGKFSSYLVLQEETRYVR